MDPVKGYPVSKGGVDPRGNHYSGTCGLGSENASAWGFKYGGGTYATSPSGPDNDTQNVWYIRVDTVASTGERHASVEVTPSIYLTHFHETNSSWQGNAEGKVSFSGVCYHVGLYWVCFEESNAGDSWSTTGFLDLVVKDAEITKGEKKEFGGGFEGNGAKLTANSEHSYSAKYNDLRARGYRFLLKLRAGFWSTTHHYQDKDATGSGHLMNKIKSDTATAEYRWTDWEDCYCGESKRPKLW